MRIKMIPVLVFMLAFGGLALMGYSQAYAEIDLLDDVCSEEELDQALCTNAFEYVIQVYSGENDIVDAAGNSIWPERDPSNNTVTFRYRASVHEDVTDCKRVDTWNYFVQRQRESVTDDLLMTDPPGAQLLLPDNSIPKCKDFVAAEGERLLKLNPSLNCGDGNEVIFGFTYTGDVLVGRCNESVVTTKSGCSGGFILGPSTGTIPFHARQYHVMQEGTVDAWFEPGPCGSDQEVIVNYVEIDGEPATPANKAWVCTPATADSDPDYVVSVPGFGDMLCIKPTKAGLQNQGCVINANPRTYLFGGDAYTR